MVSVLVDHLMNGVSHNDATWFEERVSVLSEEHQRGIRRFHNRLVDFVERKLLTSEQSNIVAEHLLRLGERQRNPANTGNIEDLFCHTLEDTKDPIRALAQALADSVKVVPMSEDAKLFPAVKSLDGQRRYEKVGDFDHLSVSDKMLVAHTMVAYGDDEMWAGACRLIRAVHPDLDDAAVDREACRMAVQSQHHPSSSFVLARTVGLTIDCAPLYERAGYDENQAKAAQNFYDVCGQFDPSWTTDFLVGEAPSGSAWSSWRSAYLEYRAKLPHELIYQLASDTLTNFHVATMESGKWTDASVMFNQVKTPVEALESIASIVNQYIAEHVALHDKPAAELTNAWTSVLGPWGIGFENDRAIVMTPKPDKVDLLQAQLDEAWSRTKA